MNDNYIDETLKRAVYGKRLRKIADIEITDNDEHAISIPISAPFSTIVFSVETNTPGETQHLDKYLVGVDDTYKLNVFNSTTSPQFNKEVYSYRDGVPDYQQSGLSVLTTTVNERPCVMTNSNNDIVMVCEDEILGVSFQYTAGDEGTVPPTSAIKIKVYIK